ncbi:hypothetical protein JG688_00016434, partial [Phytophthora aleatoria]
EVASDGGEGPARFSLHPLRSAGATALFAAGVNGLTIKRFGRWRSELRDTLRALARLVTSQRTCARRVVKADTIVELVADTQTSLMSRTPILYGAPTHSSWHYKRRTSRGDE